MKSFYNGGLKDNEPNGQGPYTFSDDAKYVGEFKNGIRQGKGTWAHPDGSMYEGEWKEGKYADK